MYGIAYAALASVRARYSLHARYLQVIQSVSALLLWANRQATHHVATDSRFATAHFIAKVMPSLVLSALAIPPRGQTEQAHE
jgi:hypothetical protein